MFEMFHVSLEDNLLETRIMVVYFFKYVIRYIVSSRTCNTLISVLTLINLYVLQG